MESSYKEIIKLQSIRGSNAKQAFVKEHSLDNWFTQFLYYALNPLFTYNVSEKTLSNLDVPDGELALFDSIFECCDYLSQLRGLDDATLRQVKLLLKKCEPEERELYIKLLSKTLRLGITAKSVNKAIPNLIPVWEVQQSFPIDSYPLEPDTEFWLTQKLNGVRATFYQGRLRGRSGAEFKGLEHITKEIMFVALAGFTLDGELTLKEKGGLSDNEAFRVATGIINSDTDDKSGICYTIFDVIPTQFFESNEKKLGYSVRRLILDELAKSLKDVESVSVLPVLYHGTDQDQIPILLDKMVEEDKEGLMVNLDVPYQRKRHRGILKVKRFYTMDLPIVRCEEGTGRLSGTLGSVVVDFKGNEVNVGTGFSDEQRATFWNGRDNLVGKLCEVKYKEISSDKKTGDESLQFPVFVGIRDDKTEVSYG